MSRGVLRNTFKTLLRSWSFWLALAALDPDAERRLFEKMQDSGRNKCVIYVTHRLSAATTANQIVVINNGECVEKGTHHELMEKKGLYYDLFSKQAQNYLQNA